MASFLDKALARKKSGQEIFPRELLWGWRIFRRCPPDFGITSPMPHRTPSLLAVTLAVLLVACQPSFLTAPIASLTVPSRTSLLTPTLMETPTLTATLEPLLSFTPTAVPLPAALVLDPANWQHWPVIPIVPEYARQIYLIGQSLGNDPHAFSIFGDCQSEPTKFMGSYESDPVMAEGLPPDLQETLAWFSGSFNRSSPTVRGGTTLPHCSGLNGTRTCMAVATL